MLGVELRALDETKKGILALILNVLQVCGSCLIKADILKGNDHTV